MFIKLYFHFLKKQIQFLLKYLFSSLLTSLLMVANKSGLRVNKNIVEKLKILIGIMFLACTAKAEIIFKPSFGVGTGEYLEQNFTELKVGGALHFVELPVAVQLHGFRRFARQADDFYGLDLELKLKRQFRVSSDYLIGTYFGPGYRFVSNDFDAPTLDFSLVLAKAQIYSVFLGYKIIMLDWMNNDYENDSLIYLGVQL